MPKPEVPDSSTEFDSDSSAPPSDQDYYASEAQNNPPPPEPNQHSVNRLVIALAVGCCVCLLCAVAGVAAFYSGVIGGGNKNDASDGPPDPKPKHPAGKDEVPPPESPDLKPGGDTDGTASRFDRLFKEDEQKKIKRAINRVRWVRLQGTADAVGATPAVPYTADELEKFFEASVGSNKEWTFSMTAGDLRGMGIDSKIIGVPGMDETADLLVPVEIRKGTGAVFHIIKVRDTKIFFGSEDADPYTLVKSTTEDSDRGEGLMWQRPGPTVDVAVFPQVKLQTQTSTEAEIAEEILTEVLGIKNPTPGQKKAMEEETTKKVKALKLEEPPAVKVTGISPSETPETAATMSETPLETGATVGVGVGDPLDDYDWTEVGPKRKSLRLDKLTLGDPIEMVRVGKWLHQKMESSPDANVALDTVMNDIQMELTAQKRAPKTGDYFSSYLQNGQIIVPLKKTLLAVAEMVFDFDSDPEKRKKQVETLETNKWPAPFDKNGPKFQAFLANKGVIRVFLESDTITLDSVAQIRDTRDNGEKWDAESASETFLSVSRWMKLRSREKECKECAVWKWTKAGVGGSSSSPLDPVFGPFETERAMPKVISKVCNLGGPQTKQFGDAFQVFQDAAEYSEDEREKWGKLWDMVEECFTEGTEGTKKFEGLEIKLMSKGEGEELKKEALAAISLSVGK